MSDYKNLYFFLFKITDAIEEIEAQNFGKAKDVLQLAQQEAEERYVNDESEE